MIIIIGELLSILTALIWAISTVILAKVVKKCDPLSANTLKTFFATILMFPLAVGMGELNNIVNIDLYSVILLIVAAILGFGIGDSCLLKSITLIGVSRSYTIAYTAPFFTILFGTLLLKEPFYYKYLIGTTIIFLGIILIVLEKNNGSRGSNWLGIIMGFAAALAWSGGSVFVALGLKTISVVLANTIRYPFLLIFLILISRLWTKKGIFTKQTLLLLMISGAISMVIGGVTFLSSVKLIGVSKAIPLSSSSPVWASLMSIIILKEKINWRTVTAAIMVIIGTYFLT